MRKLVGLLVIVALGAAVAGGYWYWRKLTESERIIAEHKRIIAGLEAKLDRVWASELVADVRVNAVTVDPATGHKGLDLTFIQYAPGTETPLFEKALLLEGEELYIDALVVKFERSLVEEGGGLRGKSLLLFRRAFGDLMEPAQGIPLYAGSGDSLIPAGLSVDAVPSDFEREIWTRFWDYANDPAAAKAAGILVAQGEAPHVKAVPGQVYKLTLRASGGLDITPRLPAAVLGRPTLGTIPAAGASAGPTAAPTASSAPAP